MRSAISRISLSLLHRGWAPDCRASAARTGKTT
jgi:hypothetical protein